MDVVAVQDSGEIRVVPPERAVEWIKAGWRMFRAEPGLWLLISTPLFLLNLMLMIPMILVWGFAIAAMLMPVVMGGLMVACDKQQQGEPLHFDYLHLGFREHTRPLATVGAILLGGMVGANVVGALLVGLGTLFSSIGVTGVGVVLALGTVLAAAVIVLGLFILLGMAAIFAPALVMLSLRAPKDALRSSLRACVRNWLPVTIFGMLLVLLMLLCLATAGLGLLVLIPIFAGAVYQAYRDIFA